MKVAVDKILLSGRSVDVSISKQIPTDDGFIVTNGFVLVHSPVDFQQEINRDKDLGNRLRNCFLTAWQTPESGIFPITDPFPLRKVAISLRDHCKVYQATNKYRQSFITFMGANTDGRMNCGTFNLQHLLHAFDCVGRKAVGTLYQNKDLFNGDVFMSVEPEDDWHNLHDEVNAIILQSRCPAGV